MIEETEAELILLRLKLRLERKEGRTVGDGLIDIRDDCRCTVFSLDLVEICFTLSSHQVVIKVEEENSHPWSEGSSI